MDALTNNTDNNNLKNIYFVIVNIRTGELIQRTYQQFIPGRMYDRDRRQYFDLEEILATPFLSAIRPSMWPYIISMNSETLVAYNVHNMNMNINSNGNNNNNSNNNIRADPPPAQLQSENSNIGDTVTENENQINNSNNNSDSAPPPNNNDNADDSDCISSVFDDWLDERETDSYQEMIADLSTSVSASAANINITVNPVHNQSLLSSSPPSPSPTPMDIIQQIILRTQSTNIFIRITIITENTFNTDGIINC